MDSAATCGEDRILEPTIKNVEAGKRIEERTLRDIAQALAISFCEPVSDDHSSPQHKGDSCFVGDSSMAVSIDTAGIGITIARDFKTYSEDDQRRLLDAIQNILEIDSNLRVRKGDPRRVKLTLNLTASQAERLLWAINRGGLNDSEVRDKRLVERLVGRARRAPFVIRLEGNLGSLSWDRLRRQLDAPESTSLVLVDLTDVHSAGAAFLGALAGFRRRMNRVGTEVRAVGASSQLRELMAICRLDDILDYDEND